MEVNSLILIFDDYEVSILIFKLIFNKKEFNVYQIDNNIFLF